MKKYIAVILILALSFSLAACGINDCNDIADFFDDDVYYAKEMTDEEIETFIDKREEEGFKFSGEIVEIVHIKNKSNTDYKPEYAYAIEFDKEGEAAAFEEYIKQYSETYCKRFENIVVYGTSKVILEIED